LVGIFDFRILPVSSLTGSGWLSFGNSLSSGSSSKRTEQLSTSDIG
jgi:hypothetical protein